MTAIVDYGAGNLTSVRYALDALNVESTVTRDADAIRAADRVVFPGVGAAKRAMENLRDLGLVEAVREAAATRPFLGICLGMQILFDFSEEDGGVETLGILPGRVRRFPDVVGFKVPEIGWNQVRVRELENQRIRELENWGIRELENQRIRELEKSLDDVNSPIRNSLIHNSQIREFYFVHSYYAEICPWTVGVTDYAGVEFTAMVKKGQLWACQFHPEKSGRVGLDLIKEWLSC